MTNRDPNRTEFSRLFMDYYECLANYFSIPEENKRLHRDLQKSDINLVCYYEWHQAMDYMRKNPYALHKHDFEKLDPQSENDFKKLLADTFNKL